MDLLAKLTGFLGYGPAPGAGQAGAQIFFRGIEEAADEGEQNLRCRAREFLPVEDLLEAHQKLGRSQCKNPFAAPARRNPGRVWNMMSRIVLALANDPEWDQRARLNKYWRERLGRRDGEAFLMECFPVPRRESDHAVPAIPGRSPEKNWPERRSRLQPLIAVSRPKYLIAYGVEPGRLCEGLVGGGKLKWMPVRNARNIEVAQSPGGLVIARTGFFGWGRFRRSDVPLLRDAMLGYVMVPISLAR